MPALPGFGKKSSGGYRYVNVFLSKNTENSRVEIFDIAFFRRYASLNTERSSKQVIYANLFCGKAL